MSSKRIRVEWQVKKVAGRTNAGLANIARFVYLIRRICFRSSIRLPRKRFIMQSVAIPKRVNKPPHQHFWLGIPIPHMTHHVAAFFG